MEKLNLPNTVKIFTDGASRGNPGPAAIGIVFYDQNDYRVYEYKETLGDQTNNYAEYMAVIRGLEFCVNEDVENVQFYCDSQLLVKQMLGEYKVKAPQIKELFLAAKELTGQLGEVGFNHVRREFNKEADALANQALDGY
ncbi:MAG: ribonuclease HI family protein [Pseudomonadota bacterium]